MSFEVSFFFTISLKAVVQPKLAFPGFVGCGELWLLSPPKAGFSSSQYQQLALQNVIIPFF